MNEPKLTELVVLVKKLRDAQREYFKLRDVVSLSLSKSLERQVDKWLREYDIEASGQRKLFEAPAE